MVRLRGDSGASYLVDPEPAGLGGQASVHPATCDDDGATVAVRVARGGGALALLIRRQAERQRALAAGPVGPWVLPVYDEGTWDGLPFAVTAWAPTSLAESGGRRELASLAGAVRALRAAGEVHGDVTPGNVLLGPDGQVWLSDWSAGGSGWLTPGFVTPERLAGAEACADDDAWGLAATAWTTLAGAPPAWTVRLAAAVVSGRTDEVRACRPSAADRRALDARTGDPALRRVLERMLRPDGSRRLRDPQVLERALLGTGDRRRTWLLGAIVLAVVAVVVLRGPAGSRCAPGYRPVGANRCLHPDGRETIRVAAGSFVLGEASPGLPDAPPRRVWLTHALEVDRAEVTQAEWRARTGEQPVVERTQTLDGGVVAPCDRWKDRSLVGPDLPVVCVSWFEAARFANLRSEADGLAPAYRIDGDRVAWDRSSSGWRLPTEAEWEAAARTAGQVDATDPCSGNVRDRSAPEHWGGEPDCDDGDPVLAPVGRHPVGGTGLWDAMGNAGEWTWDRYATFLPAWSIDPVGPEEGRSRTWRGASWTSVPKGLAARYGAVPEDHGFSVGLRLVRTPD